jgi:hypothetical protein
VGLEKLGGGLWRLYDDEPIYYLSENTVRDVDRQNGRCSTSSSPRARPRRHPVVRYLDEDDLDIDDDVDRRPTEHLPTSPMRGQVAPLMPIQDQIDLTTFGLLVAQWYSAFRQRWAIGWVAEDEAQKMKAPPPALDVRRGPRDEMKLGEFEQTDLDGYIKSREASLRHAATLSQTPVHELIGELVNLSAEALAAAEAGRDRKVDERKTLLGEAHEQTLWLAGQTQGSTVPDDAQVVWRDTSARAFSATVDALGKLVTMLGIPPQELWERVPGATQQDVERWKAAADKGDSLPGARRHARPPGPDPHVGHHDAAGARRRPRHDHRSSAKDPSSPSAGRASPPTSRARSARCSPAAGPSTRPRPSTSRRTTTARAPPSRTTAALTGRAGVASSTTSTTARPAKRAPRATCAAAPPTTCSTPSGAPSMRPAPTNRLAEW